MPPSCYCHVVTSSDVAAWIALGLSGTSVTWQIIAWVHSGPKLIVRVIRDVGDAMDPSKAFYRVAVTNNGRQPMAVHSACLTFPIAQSKRRRTWPPLHKTAPDHGASIFSYSTETRSTTVAPGEEISFEFPMAAIDAAMNALRWTHADLIGWVRSGSKWVKSRRGVTENRLEGIPFRQPRPR